MVAWADALAGGLRRLSEELSLLGEPADPGILGEFPALVVVDLEMSGPRTNLHEVLELGAVRASLAPGLPEAASWGTKVRPGGASFNLLAQLLAQHPGPWAITPDFR